MLKEFKTFILRGNVLDLAIGVIIGGAFGGIVTFELDRDLGGTKRFLERTRLFTLAESLGGVESLICHPPTMTHASVPREVRHKVGIGDGLIRFSVGIEDVADLKRDIDETLTVILG